MVESLWLCILSRLHRKDVQPFKSTIETTFVGILPSSIGDNKLSDAIAEVMHENSLFFDSNNEQMQKMLHLNDFLTE